MVIIHHMLGLILPSKHIIFPTQLSSGLLITRCSTITHFINQFKQIHFCKDPVFELLVANTHMHYGTTSYDLGLCQHKSNELKLTETQFDCCNGI